MSPQRSIAHYRITSKIGEGGMGEVYCATDTKLNREVAIKILPDAFAQDEDRMSRFTREAHVLASLNHPNIASIYGVEERALVMELVEGPTLAERIAAGPIPIHEALPIAMQIAEALDYAHERGIVHRDLKPANIKLTPQGRVKVLDFGLAFVTEGSGIPAGDPAASPTLTLRATRSGVIMGTAAYMSPEQARGQVVDKRTDIWAFGVVLYEMLTGRRLFSGGTVSDTLAAVLKEEPNWERVPLKVRRLLQACLVKDPRARLRDIADAGVLLQASEPEITATRAGRPYWAWIGLFVLVSIGAAGWWAAWRAGAPVSHPLLRFTEDLGGQAHMSLALSPDGTRVAFVSADRQLHLRLLDNAKSVALAGTDGASDPVFSPDGAWIGFFAGGKLKKVAVQGGAPINLCDIPLGSLGASWGEDGNIVYPPTNRSALLRVSDAGGTPEPATQLDAKKNEITHRFPQVLPGAQAVLFTSGTPGNYEDASLDVQVFKTGERKTIYRGGYHGRYVPPGYLLFMHEGTLFAAPMDLKNLKLTGRPVPMLDDVRSGPASGSAPFDVSQSGTMAYILAPNSPLQALAWLDASGKLERMSAPPRKYDGPFTVSPDGSRLAVTIRDGAFGNIWIYEWGHDRLFPLTAGKNVMAYPVWSPYGKHVIFGWSGGDGGGPGIYWVRADGTNRPERIVELPVSSGNLLSLSPDGTRLVYFSMGGLWIVSLDMSDAEHPKAGKPQDLFPGLRITNFPAISPDGHWISYGSNNSGRQEVYVSAFPGAGGKWLISTAGGTFSAWSRRTPELFYQAANGKMMTVRYNVKGDSFEADQPRLWSDRAIGIGNLGFAPDGKRLVTAIPADDSVQTQPTQAVFLVNFVDELRRRLRAK